MSPPVRKASYVEPELRPGRIDAQWVRIAERLPKAPRRKFPLAWAAVGLSACAALLVVFLRTPAPDPSVWAGSLVASDEAPVDVTLAEGTRIELEPRSEVELLKSTPRAVQLSLSGGSARFDVAKRPERRFSVRSGPVEVLVTGTQFRVTRTPTSEGERVKVEVEQGSVEVFRDGHVVAHLRGGEHWSATIERPSQRVTSDAAQTLKAERPEPDGAANETKAHEPRKRQARSDEVSPAEALFARANLARRAGRLKDAANLFEELVQKYPRDRHAALSAFELGRMRMDSFHDMPGAIHALERALQLDARRSFAEDALARLVVAHEAVGDRRSCIKARERYQARYPEGVHGQYLAERCGSR